MQVAVLEPRQLLGQQRRTVLGDLPSTVPLLGVGALGGPYPGVDLLDGGEHGMVGRTHAHGQVAIRQRGDRREDPVVQSVLGPVEHVDAGRAPLLQLIPHELEGPGGHVIVTNNVVRRANKLLRAVTGQRIEYPVRPANDTFGIRRREEQVLGTEAALVAIDVFHDSPAMVGGIGHRRITDRDTLNRETAEIPLNRLLCDYATK